MILFCYSRAVTDAPISDSPATNTPQQSGPSSSPHTPASVAPRGRKRPSGEVLDAIRESNDRFLALAQSQNEAFNNRFDRLTTIMENTMSRMVDVLTQLPRAADSEQHDRSTFEDNGAVYRSL